MGESAPVTQEAADGPYMNHRHAVTACVWASRRLTDRSLYLNTGGVLHLGLTVNQLNLCLPPAWACPMAMACFAHHVIQRLHGQSTVSSFHFNAQQPKLLGIQMGVHNIWHCYCRQGV